MPIRRGLLFSLSLCATLSVAGPVWATIDNLKSFKQAYPGKEPKAYSCKVCHQGVMGTKDNLNAYGNALKQFKKALGAKKLVAEDYRAFDAADTDADGATNAQELEAGTDPLDPASVPSGEATGPSRAPPLDAGQPVEKDDKTPKPTTPSETAPEQQQEVKP